MSNNMNLQKAILIHHSANRSIVIAHHSASTGHIPQRSFASFHAKDKGWQQYAFIIPLTYEKNNSEG